MPNQPRTEARTVRVSDELWSAATTRARARGESVSEAVRRALEEYAASEEEARP